MNDIPVASTSSFRAATETPLPESRQSLDEQPDLVNGTAIQHEKQDAEEVDKGTGDLKKNGEDDNEGDGDGELDSTTRIVQLEGDLERVTEERNGLEAQYRNLLGKLTNMRNTLGDKLRQDAVWSIIVELASLDSGVSSLDRMNWTDENNK